MDVPLRVGWVVGAMSLPLAAGLLAAYPLWKKHVTDDMGAVVGAGVVLLMTVVFLAREFGEMEALIRYCRSNEIPCHLRPQPFVRYAIYASIGMVQVIVVFSVGLFAEEHFRRRDR